MLHTLDELKELIGQITDEHVIVFDKPDYCTAFVGMSYDNRAIYDYDKMIDYLVERDEMTFEDAADFISYNTIRSLGYQPNGPIVLMPVDVELL